MEARRRLTQRARREELVFYLCVLPWIIGFVGLQLGPMISSVFFSLTAYNIIMPWRWLGLANYKEILTDQYFWISLRVTSIYSVGSVAANMFTSLFVASILNRDIKGLSWFRTLYYLPSVVSGVAVSMLWMYIFNPEFGILNYLLWEVFGIRGPSWIYSETWALPSLILMGLWGIGGGIIIYLAGLQGIPTELYEAAEIDGAGGWRKLLHITLPMMSPVIYFQLVMGIIGSFQVFTQAYVMTQGGPHWATLFYVLYLYRNAFETFRMGYASALAWVLFAILVTLTLLVTRSASSWVHYEESVN
jgi:multiple sugar transport system permease protein